MRPRKSEAIRDLAACGVGFVTLLTLAVFAPPPSKFVPATAIDTTDRLDLEPTEPLLLAFLVVVTLLACTLVLLSFFRLFDRVRARSLRLVRRVAGSPRRSVLGVVAVLSTGLLSTLRTAGDRSQVASASESAASLDHVPVDSSGTSRQSGGSTRPLPALASSGLAAGLTAHVMRQRAVILASAPSHARLAPLTAPSLATGVALFERAKSAEEMTSVVGTESGRGGGPPPDSLLVPLGVDRDRLVTVALRPGEALSVDAELTEAMHVIRHLLNTVVLAPWLESPVVILYGFPIEHVIVEETVRVASTPESVLDAVVTARGSRLSAHIVVVARTYVPQFDRLADYGALVITMCAATSRPVTRVVRESVGWRISTTGECFRPYGVTVPEVGILRSSVREMTTIETDQITTPGHRRSWEALVRVLGPVEVVRHDELEVVFRKAKSVELLCWLSFHRDRPTVSGARTALWDVDVRDATFHNVLSELRRGLAVAGLPDSVGRRSKHRLFVDDRLVTDGDLLRAALDASERMSVTAATECLCGVLRLVRGLPFSAANYAWADAEGITSTLYWLVSRAVERVSTLCDGHGNEEALLEATAAGLRMSPGDEAFSLLRRRVFSKG